MNERSAWAVGGGLMLGVGVGFFFFPQSIFSFVGSIIAGIGIGLLFASIIGIKK